MFCRIQIDRQKGIYKNLTMLNSVKLDIEKLHEKNNTDNYFLNLSLVILNRVE